MIHPETILTLENYKLVIVKSGSFPNREVEELVANCKILDTRESTGYAAINLNTGVVEFESAVLPTALNTVISFDNALSKVLGELDLEL